MTKSEVLNLAADLKEKTAALSDFIWDHPETAFEEFESSKALQNALEAEGFQVKAGLAGIETAFSGTWGCGKPVIGFLGEFDALNGLSQVHGAVRQEPLISGGKGHGCGHHLLGAGSVAAAVMLKEYLKSNHLPGTVVYFGCPGEEGGSGKTFMARDGVFDELDCAITWHPGDSNIVAMISLLANVQLSYHFHGRAAHAAANPHAGRSALDAVELMNTGVQFLREHMIPEARIHYAITNAGGNSPNVVQPEAEVLYLIRAPKNEQVQELLERVNKIAQGAALMTETEVTPIFFKACSNLVPNRVLAECMQANLEFLHLPEIKPEWLEHAKALSTTFEGPYMANQETLLKQGKYICDTVSPLMKAEFVLPGSSDVGDVSWICPTVQCTTAAQYVGTPAHSWQLVSQGKTDVAHEMTMLAAQIMTGTAIDLVEQPELIRKAKEELSKRLHGSKYICPIPKDAQPRAIDTAE